MANETAESEETIVWEEEANAVIQDIRQHVHSISVSRMPSSLEKIYFNLTTLELKEFCVELTAAGFRIVGEKHDSQEETGKYEVFETPYSLLDSLSPAYKSSFSAELLEKLKQLQEAEDEKRGEGSEEGGS